MMGQVTYEWTDNTTAEQYLKIQSALAQFKGPRTDCNEYMALKEAKRVPLRVLEYNES